MSPSKPKRKPRKATAVADRLKDQLRQQAEELLAHSRKVSSMPHRGARGVERESPLRGFLSDHVPRRFRVGTGCIVSATMAPPHQHDIVIADAHNCLTLLQEANSSTFPIEAVHSVISVKSGPALTLNEVAEPFIGLRSLCPTMGCVRMSPAMPGNASGRTSPATHHLFAYRGPKDADRLATSVDDLNQRSATHMGRYPIDQVVVLTSGKSTIPCRAAT